MRSFVVGGAGFIGSHLVDRLVARGPVTVFDDLSVGKLEFVADHLASGRATFVHGDCRILNEVDGALAGHDVVFHLAANPEPRRGLDDTRLDLELGTIATFNVIEAARRRKIGRFVLASSAAVYGETDRVCGEEDLGRLPTSLYGASKLAAESLVAAFAESFGMRNVVFRFGDVVGPRGVRGTVFDLLRKLQASHDVLEVVGDGSGATPYLHVEDCVDAMLFALDRTVEKKLEVFNIAPRGATAVRFLAEKTVAASPYPHATIRYGSGDRGAPGDGPKPRLSMEKLERLGFSLRNTSDEAALRSIRALAADVFG